MLFHNKKVNPTRFSALLAGSFGYEEEETLKLLMPSSGVGFFIILLAG